MRRDVARCFSRRNASTLMVSHPPLVRAIHDDPLRIEASKRCTNNASTGRNLIKRPRTTSVATSAASNTYCKFSIPSMGFRPCVRPIIYLSARSSVVDYAARYFASGKELIFLCAKVNGRVCTQTHLSTRIYVSRYIFTIVSSPIVLEHRKSNSNNEIVTRNFFSFLLFS